MMKMRIKQKLDKLKIFKKIIKKSKLTEKDALEIGKKINSSMHKKYVTKG